MTKIASKPSANIQKLLLELENPESGVKEYGMSIDDALYLIKSYRSLEKKNLVMKEALEECTKITSYPAIHFKEVAQKALSSLTTL